MSAWSVLLVGVILSPDGDPVIEADAFAKRLKTGDAYVVLDARQSDAYRAGHVTGAVQIDPVAWSAASLNESTDLTQVEYWQRRIGELGITPKSKVIVYDGGKLVDAARVWFILRHFGVADVWVVNGGFKAIEELAASGDIAIDEQEVTPPTTTYKAEKGDERGRLATRAQTREAVDNPRVVVLDARTREEFTGLDRRSNTRGGHLPRAINLPHDRVLDEKGRLRPAAELKAIFGEAGLRPDMPILTHCQSGGRSSIMTLALLRAGYPLVQNYYASYGDWDRDPGCPIVTPEPPATRPHSPAKSSP